MTWLDKQVSSTDVVTTVTKTTTYTELGDVTKKFNDKYIQCNEDVLNGVDIDGFLFFPKSVQSDESFSHREFVRTKIMSGGEFVSRGQFICREYSFDTIIDICEPELLEKYLKVFNIMENKVCRVTSPYMEKMFNAEVKITVTYPEASPHVIECNVHIKEIPSVMRRVVGDPVIQYPSINTVSDIQIKERGTEKPKNDDEIEHKDVYDSYNSSQSSEN